MDPIALHAAFVEVHRVHRVTGSPVSSPGLVDFQASERLEDEVAEPMELASLWCLGFTPNGLIHVMLIHVDVAGRILNDLFESS